MVQGLWVGSHLSKMERLSIQSFIDNGHLYHLYAYRRVDNVPGGATILDGNEILPESEIFQYEQHRSYSAFSNVFRYKLLLERGGWWVDTDMVCLKPFDFPDAYVFSSELAIDRQVINVGALKVPAGCDLMRNMFEESISRDRARLAWGEIGPKLFDKTVRDCGLEGYAQPHWAFCRLGHKDWEHMLNPDSEWELKGDEFGLHLWNEKWRRAGADKDADYEPACLYERLKRRYLDLNTKA